MKMLDEQTQNFAGSSWTVSRSGRTRSEIAREREADPQIKELRRQQMKNRWKDPEFKTKISAALKGNHGRSGKPLSFKHRLGLSNPLTARTMSKEESAWLGAFIEADGTAGVYKNGSCLGLGIGQANVEPITTALRITQAGTVRYGKDRTTGKDGWGWGVSARADAYFIAKQCAPYSWKIQRALKLLNKMGIVIAEILCKRLPDEGCDLETARREDAKVRG